MVDGTPASLGLRLSDDEWLQLVARYRDDSELGSLGEYHLEAEIGRAEAALRTYGARLGFRSCCLRLISEKASPPASHESQSDECDGQHGDSASST